MRVVTRVCNRGIIRHWRVWRIARVRRSVIFHVLLQRLVSALEAKILQMVSNLAFNFNLRRYTAGVSVMLGFDCEATHAVGELLRACTRPRLVHNHHESGPCVCMNFHP